jgi:hypothetical protein
MTDQVFSAEKERIKALFLEAAEGEAEAIAGLLAGSETEDLLGNTEFALRDAVLKLGARTLEGAVNERAKKRGTKVAAPLAAVENQPAL